MRGTPGGGGNILRELSRGFSSSSDRPYWLTTPRPMKQVFAGVDVILREQIMNGYNRR